MKQKRHGIAFTIITAILLSQVSFALLVQAIGAVLFTNSFKKEYATSTYHMADTATSLVNGDHLYDYQTGEYVEEYYQTKAYLDAYCMKMNVSLVYVIRVDTSDYGRFVSIFNSVNNTVDKTNYTEWEIGYRRDTTNDEYRKKYQAMYEQTAPYETVYRTTRLNGKQPHITTMVPITDSACKTVGVLCIQRPMRELRDAYRPYLMNVAVWALVSCIITGALAAFYIRRQFLRPIKKTADEATRFARENTKGEPLGKISRLKEIDDLAGAIDTMETDMVQYMENLTSLTAEQERIGAELDLATRIQYAMLPHVFPPFPDRKEFDLYASMDPAKEVGGDFYDFFLVDDDHLCMVMADVSGKGVPAALFMMASKIILQSCAMLGNSAAEILTKTNEAICSNNQEQMFITVWLGILEISTGKLTAANAGHEYPVLKRPDGRFELVKDKHGFVIGGMDGMKYKEYEMTLEPGTKLFLYTDGVPEATDENGMLFGATRMVDALNKEPAADPKGVLKNVRAAVDDFTEDAEQFDDLTMLCMAYYGAETDTNARELTVEASTENLSKVTAFIDELLEQADCPGKTRMQIELAVEEIFVNIAHYAYAPEKGDATIRVELTEEPRSASITFIDRGKPYDPLQKTDPDVTLSAEERSVGGLGIFMTKKVMDDVSYEYRSGQNILTLKKILLGGKNA